MALSKSLSVQELSKDVQTVPECYCVNPEPSILIDNDPIPVLDMATLTAEKLHSACKEWGMFQLLNHGVNSSLVANLKYDIEEFYKLPLEEKLKYQRKSGEVEGYGQTILLSTDQKVDWADRLLMMINPIYMRKPDLFPELPSSLRETLEAYFKETENLAMKLLQLIAETLRIDKKEIEAVFEDGIRAVRMTHYPPCPQPGKVIGLTPHSDASGITILLQVNGVEGLQVKRNGVWLPVNILPEALVVNVGDILEILSNGIFKSVEHRATVNSDKERISMAIFFNPKIEAEIKPSTCLIKPPLYKTVVMEKYLKDFFARKLDGKSYIDTMKINGKENGSMVN